MGSFMQMSTGRVARLTTIVQSSNEIDAEERSQVLALLQGKQNPFGDYSAQSGEIVGMLKAMKDEMDKDLNGAISAEDAAKAGFDQLATAKKAEIAAASEAIEAKTKRQG